MKKKELYVLFIALGVLMFVCAWQFGYNPLQEKTEVISAENDTLSSEISRLEELDKNKEQYIANTETMKVECTEIYSRFPAGLLPEDDIMYTNGMELVETNEIAVPSMSLGMPSIVTYQGNLSIDGYELQDDTVQMLRAEDNFSFVTTYQGLKNTMDYIYNIPGRKSVSSISLSSSADGYLNGTMSLNMYYLVGTDNQYTPTDIPFVTLGKENIFGVIDDAVKEEAE